MQFHGFKTLLHKPMGDIFIYVFIWTKTMRLKYINLREEKRWITPDFSSFLSDIQKSICIPISRFRGHNKCLKSWGWKHSGFSCQWVWCGWRTNSSNVRLAGGSRKPDSVANWWQAAADEPVTHCEDWKQMRWVLHCLPCGWQCGLIRALCAHMANENKCNICTKFTGWFQEKVTGDTFPFAHRVQKVCV